MSNSPRPRSLVVIIEDKDSMPDERAISEEDARRLRKELIEKLKRRFGDKLKIQKLPVSH